MNIDQIRQLHANENEYHALTNEKFLGIMFFGCTLIPCILFIIQSIQPIIPVFILFFALIILPSGVLFSINGFRLLFEDKIQLAFDLAYISWLGKRK